MKTYVCDACGEVINDPHEMKMKEFYIGMTIESYGALPCNEKRKIKVHLCDDCFHSLHEIAAKKAEEKGEKPKISLTDLFREHLNPFRHCNASLSYYAFESREIERIRKEGTAMCGDVKMDESQQRAFGILDELDHLVTDCSNLRNLADKAKWHPEHLDHYHELICIVRRELARAIQTRNVVTITPEFTDMKEVEE